MLVLLFATAGSRSGGVVSSRAAERDCGRAGLGWRRRAGAVALAPDVAGLRRRWCWVWIGGTSSAGIGEGRRVMAGNGNVDGAVGDG